MILQLGPCGALALSCRFVATFTSSSGGLGSSTLASVPGVVACWEDRSSLKDSRTCVSSWTMRSISCRQDLLHDTRAGSRKEREEERERETQRHARTHTHTHTQASTSTPEMQPGHSSNAWRRCGKFCFLHWVDCHSGTSDRLRWNSSFIATLHIGFGHVVQSSGWKASRT